MIELGKGVGAIRCLAQLLASVLFILLGTGFAVAKSQPLHNLSFFPAQINIAAQHATIAAAARKHALAIEPTLDDMDYCACLELVLLQLMARRM